MRQLPGLFAVDPNWVAKNICPLMAWGKRNKIAINAWNNFLLSTIYKPKLLDVLGSSFAKTATHFDDLSNRAQTGYAALLLHHAINATTKQKKSTVGKAIKMMPQKGREEICRQVAGRLQVAGERADAVWDKEIGPFLRDVWPGEAKYNSTKVFSNLAWGAMFLRESFPKAVDALSRFNNVKQRHLPLLSILASGQKGQSSNCERHPKSALKLLAMLTRFLNGQKKELQQCLATIEQKVGADLTQCEKLQLKKLQDKAHDLSY